MKAGLSATVAVVLMSGVANAAAPTSPLIAQAKKLIASETIDPGSLQYRKLRVVKGAVKGKPISAACGEFNSKNRFGGYIGYAAFAYEPTVIHGAISRSGEGKIEFYGDSDTNADVEDKAYILGLCLGGA